MTTHEDFFKKAIDALSSAQIPYMISDSVATSFHGQPRATKDADIVIAPTKEQLQNFIQSLGDEYYVSLNAATQALADNSTFNVIDRNSGWKADFIIRKERPFSICEFQRRCNVTMMGYDFLIVSPEDAILTRLEWAKNTRSEQQFRDALGVAVVQWDRLDQGYLQKWAKELQAERSLGDLLEQAKKLVDSK
ncbi:MAG: hypothetical protein JSW23_03500 [Planctomycetota bacterium]|nr:MAG: hypothetical protein JSW23_03500 [Planctomycetota bacterium]